MHVWLSYSDHGSSDMCLGQVCMTAISCRCIGIRTHPQCYWSGIQCGALICMLVHWGWGTKSLNGMGYLCKNISAQMMAQELWDGVLGLGDWCQDMGAGIKDPCARGWHVWIYLARPPVPWGLFQAFGDYMQCSDAFGWLMPGHWCKCFGWHTCFVHNMWCQNMGACPPGAWLP